jgi:quinol monooxygenase YgiN
MDLHFFARFHVEEGKEEEAVEAIRAVLGPSREEAGCIAIRAFRSIRHPKLFVIHSCWIDEAAFDLHAKLPHTIRFIETMNELVDERPEMSRTHELI